MKAHTNYTTPIATTPWMQRTMMVLAILIVGSIALAYIVRQRGQPIQSAIIPAASVQAPAASNWRFRDEALAGVQSQQAIGAYTLPERLSDVRTASAVSNAAPAPAASNWRFRDEALAGVQSQQAIDAYTLPERLSDMPKTAPAQTARMTTVQRYGAFNRIFADEQLAAQAYMTLQETPPDARGSGPR